MRKILMLCVAATALTCASPVLAEIYRGSPTIEENTRIVGDCASLDACFAALQKIIPAKYDGQVLVDERIRDRLTPYGDAAKERLFELALNGSPGWQNVAESLLGDWPDLKPTDVPRLTRMLAMHPNHAAARGLGRIGTDEAIDALLADFKDDGGQTVYGLRLVGPRVLPRLTPLLSDPERYRPTMSIIREMGEPAAVAGPGWAATAIDQGLPKAERIGALRGLEAMGVHGRAVSATLHPLLVDPERDIASAALNALQQAGDPVIVPMIAEGCTGFADTTEWVSRTAWSCLRDIAAFGADGKPAAPAVRRFLESPNGDEQAAAATTLGLIGDTPSAAALERALASRDWRVVFAAARSLGWLGASKARSALANVASHHWLPEVREEAARAVAALDSPPGYNAPPRGRPSQYPFMHAEDAVTLVPDHSDLKPEICPSGSWTWNGRPVSAAPQRDNRETAQSVRFTDGVLIAIDNGEWGGSLSWRPKRGGSIDLYPENASGVARAGAGAVAAFGLAHLSIDFGTLARVERGVGGGWSLADIGRLPGDSSGIKALGDGLFGVVSHGRLVVFNDQEILGLGDCVR